MATTFTYAEEKTLSDLRSLVLRRLRQIDTARYSPTAGTADYDWFDDAINMGLKKFVRETKCLKSYAAYVPVANYQWYRCPESYVDLKAAYYYDASIDNGYRELIFKSTGELDDEISDWRTKTDAPKYICIDRMFGRRWFFGLVPIPSSAGTTVVFDTTYGSKLTDICNLTTYNEEFVELPQTGEFFCPSSQSSPGLPFSNVDKDIVLVYYRLPRKLDTESQYPEIPREYHEVLADYAAWELLRHNPEDNAEYKRAQGYIESFNVEIKSFISKRKDVGVRAKELKIRPAQQSWQQGMPYYKGLP